MNSNARKLADRQALKRKFLACFDARATNAATLRDVVTTLIRCGVSRETLVHWAVNAGFPKVTVSSAISRILCSLGIRERHEGGGRKPSRDALALLEYARSRYGERALKVLRAALRAGKSEADALENLRLAVEAGRNENKCGTAIRRLMTPDKTRLSAFKAGFNATINRSRRIRS